MHLIASSVLGVLLMMAPTAAELGWEKAESYYQQGQYAAALAEFRAMEPSEGPGVQAWRFNMAQVWFALDSLPQAEARYQSLNSLLPTKARAQALNNLALIALQQRRSTDALRLLYQAVLLAPDLPEPRFNYELLLRKLPPPPPQPPSNPPPPPATERLGSTEPPDALPLPEAQRLLDAIEAQELQYYQQLRKTPKSLPSGNQPQW